MSNYLFPTIMVFCIAMLGLTLYLTPQFASQNVPLGVRVPSAHLNSAEVTGAIAGYRKHVLIASTFACLATLAAYRFPFVSLFTIYIPLIAGFWSYQIQRKKIITAKKEQGWFDDVEIAISGKVSTRSEQRRTSPRARMQAAKTPERDYDYILASLPVPQFPWAAAFASLVVLTVGMAFVAMRWEDIPAVLATHWGSGFEPDAWSEKSIGSVFMSTFFPAGTIAFILVITGLITSVDVHNRSDRGIRGQLRTQVILAATNTGMGLLCLALAVGGMALQVVSVLPQYQRFLPAVIAVFLVLVVGTSIGMLIPIMHGQTKVDDLTRGLNFGDSGQESPDNDRFYKWGMFYYNPDDPAVLIEKRFGAGVDFNYATWQGKLFIAAMVALIAIPIALIFI